ncbi:MAG: DNA polymerase III subunit delta' [Candidatus Puniceispirillaceae bacterium]
MTETIAEIYRPLRGHQRQISQAETSFAGGKMHHAWLLTGQSGIGKSLFAHHLAAAIISAQDTESALFSDDVPFSLALDENNPVTRQVLQLAHPDFLYIAPLQDEKNKSGVIKVEQIRSLIPFFSHKSASGGWRVAIIDNLDMVNVQGANAMLKMVEEPPEKSIILLIARSSGRVLPTIRSRCRELKFDPLDQDDQIAVLSQYLPDAEPAALRQLALFSGGSIGYALEIAQTDTVDLYEASCLILAKSDYDGKALLDISAKWGATRNKNMVALARQSFSRILSQAALQAAGQGQEASLLSCEEALISALCRHAKAPILADLHDDFLETLTKAERSFADMPGVFLALFDKIHSIAHP